MPKRKPNNSGRPFDLDDYEWSEYRLIHFFLHGTQVGYAGDAYLVPSNVIARQFEELVRRHEKVAAKILLYCHRQEVSDRRLIGRALAILGRRKSKYFDTLFHLIIRDADDLLYFMAGVEAERETNARPNGVIKRTVSEWLEARLTAKDAVLHRKKRPRHTMSLRDAIILTHPVFRYVSPLVDFVLGEARDDGSPEVEAAVRLLHATTKEEKRAALRVAPVPWKVASSVIGRDPELWEAALPGMDLDDLLSTLPTQAEVMDFPEGSSRYDAVAATLARLRATAHPVALIRAMRKLYTNTAGPVIPLLAAEAAIAATRLRPVRGAPCLRAIDRSGSCPPDFFALSLTAMSFGEGHQTLLVDDVVENWLLSPRTLVPSLIDLRPRGGFQPEWVTHAIASAHPTPQAVVFAVREVPPSTSVFWVAMKELRRKHPLLVFAFVLPKAAAVPANFGDLLTRVIQGPETLSGYAQSIGSPIAQVWLADATELD